MSKQETITFKNIPPLRTFGDLTILSAQIEKYPELEQLIIHASDEHELISQYLNCAHPELKFEITLEGGDGDMGINGDMFEEQDLTTEEGFLNALARRYGESHDFDFSKPDEAIYFVNGRVIKYFKDPKVVAKRIERAGLLSGLVPQIDYAGENFYSYKFVPGKTIYESLTPGMTTNFLEWCSAKLWNPQEIEMDDQSRAEFEKNCLEFYKTKTLGRVQLYWKNCGHDDSATIVNGITTPKLEELLSMVDWNWLSKGIPSRFHGDLQFDNSLFNQNTDSFMLLDWRHEFAGMTHYADMYYDLGKLNGGLITPYSAIKKNRFSYRQDGDRVSLEIEMPKHLDTARLEFDAFVEEHGLDQKRISLITALIFVNMSPLHTTPFDLYLHQLGKMMLTNHFEKYGKN